MEQLPDTLPVHDKVMLHQSAGALGPDRKKSTILLALIILLLGGAALLYFAHQRGGLDKLLGQ